MFWLSAEISCGSYSYNFLYFLRLKLRFALTHACVTVCCLIPLCLNIQRSIGQNIAEEKSRGAKTFFADRGESRSGSVDPIFFSSIRNLLMISNFLDENGTGVTWTRSYKQFWRNLTTLRRN